MTETEMKQNAIDAENARTQVDLAIKAADMMHKHKKDLIETTHKVTRKT